LKDNLLTLPLRQTKHYKTKVIVVTIGASNTFQLKVNAICRATSKSLPKTKIQLHNTDHKVADGIYVAGTLAGWRSQLTIAAGVAPQ
jgi:uncharacterized protein with FMN-binding domain